VFKIPGNKCLDRGDGETDSDEPNLKHLDQGDGETDPEERNISLRLLSLGERLERFSGAKLTFTSDIAEKAVARSKLKGVKGETTFGGDVYEKCSDDDDFDVFY
jgi:hypothetical protein